MVSKEQPDKVASYKSGNFHFQVGPFFPYCPTHGPLCPSILKYTTSSISMFNKVLLGTNNHDKYLSALLESQSCICRVHTRTESGLPVLVRVRHTRILVLNCSSLSLLSVTEYMHLVTCSSRTLSLSRSLSCGKERERVKNKKEQLTHLSRSHRLLTSHATTFTLAPVSHQCDFLLPSLCHQHEYEQG